VPMTRVGTVPSSSSKSSTRLACLEDTLKLMSPATMVAPSGKLRPPGRRSPVGHMHHLLGGLRAQDLRERRQPKFRHSHDIIADTLNSLPIPALGHEDRL
jgi:hypothetical protein